MLNVLSIASSLIYIIPGVMVIWVLNRWGTKSAILYSSIVLVIGNWIIYAGAATKNFDVNIAGTVIHSLAMPFILSVPTRYSRQWFADNERTLATALPSLAYPLGSGVGALTGPYMVKPLGKFSKHPARSICCSLSLTELSL
jgi:predicted MFS family arabinose efflux permease